MKKTISLLLALVMAVCLCACGNSAESNDNGQNTEPGELETFTTSTPEPAPEPTTEATSKPTPEPTPTPAMTAEELENALLNEPMYVVKTKYLVQDDRYKALYPDMLQVVVKNNSGTDIKNAVVAYVAWDSNGFPVKINPKFGRGSYVVLCDLDDVNLIDGATRGEDEGLALSSDTDNIATFKAIVVSYEDFDGNRWDNPYYDIWTEMYSDKKLQ